jgi:hypothetical protein
MTIQEYLHKIEALEREKTKITFPENDDMELCIQKIQQGSAQSYFMLDDLLEKTSGMVLINKNAIKQFANHLGLFFLEEQETGNVCFANNEEMRPEFRQSFRLIDLLDYIYTFMYSSIYRDSQKIIIPSEKDFFWELAKIGLSLRKEKL